MLLFYGIVYVNKYKLTINMYTQKVTVNLISATGDPSLCFNVIHKKWSGCTAHMLPEVIGADQTSFIQGG